MCVLDKGDSYPPPSALVFRSNAKTFVKNACKRQCYAQGACAPLLPFSPLSIDRLPRRAPACLCRHNTTRNVVYQPPSQPLPPYYPIPDTHHPPTPYTQKINLSR